MRAEIVRAKDRRRMMLSSGAAFLVYALAGLAFVLFGLLKPEELGRRGGPIKVRLGSPAGLDEVSRTMPGAGLPSGGLSPAAIAKATAQSPAVQAAPPAPTPSAPAAGKTVPMPLAQPQKAVAKAPEPVANPPAGGKAGAPSSPGVAVGEGLPVGQSGGAGAGPGGASIKGSEQGNSFETNYETGGAKIGRTLYVPIFLYMPVPETISRAVYDAIPAGKSGFPTKDVRKVEFRAYYSLVGEQWKLVKVPTPAQRPNLWLMLQDAGYPLAKAEYKAGKALRPVVLSFKVGPAGATGSPELQSVEVVSSSGFAELDEAVVFGFRQAAFFNDSPDAVTGRFTYDFE